MAKKTETERDPLNAPYGKTAEPRDKTLAVRMTDSTQKKIAALVLAHECSAGLLVEKLVDLELERLRREEGRVWDGERFVRTERPVAISMLTLRPEPVPNVGLVSRTPNALAEELEAIAGEIRRRATGSADA
jgi:hypothetical protein